MSRYDEWADELLSRRYPEGHIIEHDVFWKLFRLERKESGTFSELQRQELRFAGDMSSLQRALWRRGNDLQNVRGKGYAFVPYHDRPSRAKKDGERAVARGLRDWRARLRSIPNPSQLNWEAKAERDRALLKIGVIQGALRAKGE